MVVSINKQVNGFKLDPSIGDFVLTDPNMKIPARGKIDPPVKEYVKSKKEGKKP